MKTKRGYKPEQARNAYGPGVGVGKALLRATLGQAFKENPDSVCDCVTALRYVERGRKKKLSGEEQRIAREFLVALATGDEAWLMARVKACKSHAFSCFMRPEKLKPADPLRAHLGEIAFKQLQGSIGLLDIDGLRKLIGGEVGDDWPEDEKTLRQACKDMGVKLNAKRGPKPGSDKFRHSKILAGFRKG